MTIQYLKDNCEYKYAYIDFDNINENCGYLYTINDIKYFIDLKETYIKVVNEYW